MALFNATTISDGNLMQSNKWMVALEAPRALRGPQCSASFVKSSIRSDGMLEMSDMNNLIRTQHVPRQFWSQRAIGGRPGTFIQRTRLGPRALTEDTSAGTASDYAEGGDEEDLKQGEFKEWDALTARLADSATFAFLLLQLPQIILNTQNLMANNYAALSAIPWMGQLTGLLGNLSLLSYFAGKKERGAMVVQAVGVVSTLLVLSQLALAGSMPALAFAVTASIVVVGLLLNFLSYQNMLSPALWQLWEEVVTVGGVTVLPQVMWSTFEPYIPPSILPGTIFGVIAVTLVVLARVNKLPAKGLKLLGAVSAWTATLLFMWAPVAQAWTNHLNPANVKGLSVFTVLLAMIGNSLLLPRALFTRDLMWFTGSSWGTLLQGWGILVSMLMFGCISDTLFYGVSAVLFLWLGMMFVNDSKAYSLNSPVQSFIELISGSRAS